MRTKSVVVQTHLSFPFNLTSRGVFEFQLLNRIISIISGFALLLSHRLLALVPDDLLPRRAIYTKCVMKAKSARNPIAAFGALDQQQHARLRSSVSFLTKESPAQPIEPPSGVMPGRRSVADQT